MGRRRVSGHTAGPGGVPVSRYPLSPGYTHDAAPGYPASWPHGLWQQRAISKQAGQRGRVTRMVANRGHRYRYAARPWLTLAGIAAAGLVMHLLPPARAAWWLLLPAGAIASWHQQHRQRSRSRQHGPADQRGHIPRGELLRRIYAVTCAAVAAGWLAVVARFGVTAGPGRLAVLALAVPGLWPLGWLWWQHHRIRPSGQPRLPERDPVAEAWEAHVGGPGGLYPGTQLTGRTRHTGATAYLIVGVRGKHTTKQLTSEDAHAKIASALMLDPERVHLERPPKGPDRNGVNARLVVMDESNPQLQAEIAWQGPTLDKATGTWQVGVYPDTPARCRLYQARNGMPHRAVNNAVSGLMGYGKSRFTELSIAEMLWSGLFVVWYGDGQEGASGPGLRDHVDWYATRREEIVRMLKAAWKVAKARQRHDQDICWTDSHGHQRTGRGFWPASPAEPFLQVILDEIQEMLTDPRVARLVRALQRLGPKVGIGVTLVTQEWLVHETGGASGDMGAQSIRAFAQTGNVVLFKAGSDINANALGGTLAGVNPRTLPGEPGWCYLLGPGTRPVPARTFHIDPDDVYHWLAQAAAVKAQLDELSARAAGEDYATRWQRLSATTAGDSDAVLDGLEDELAELLGENQPGLAPPGSALEGMTIKQAVLEAIRAHGPLKRADIDGALAGQGRIASKSAIDQALAAWQRTGHLTSKGGGIWDIPDRDDRAADAEDRAAVAGLEAHRPGS